MGNLADAPAGPVPLFEETRSERLCDRPRKGEPTMATTADRNVELVKECYAAFTRGDIATIMDHIAPDGAGFAGWSVLSAAAPAAPWHGQSRTKSEVSAFFAALTTALDFTRFEPADYAASDEHVYATIDMEATVRATGRKLRFGHVMHRFTVRGGRVVEFRASEDTALTRDTLAAR
jgi:ketosteroid isomerase-like protein